MRVTANGHRRRSAAEWRGIIERYRQSGLGTNEFCAQEGVRVGTFEQWYRRHRHAEHRTRQFDVYKIYAESFRGKEHLRQIQEEAQVLIAQAFAAMGPRREKRDRDT